MLIVKLGIVCGTESGVLVFGYFGHYWSTFGFSPVGHRPRESSSGRTRYGGGRIKSKGLPEPGCGELTSQCCNGIPESCGSK